MTTLTPSFLAARAVSIISWRRPLAHPFGVAVTPDVGGHDGLVALVNQVADGLPDQVVADGVDPQAVLGEQVEHALDVAVLVERPLHVEVVAPAGQFQAVEAHLFGEGREFGERQIGPLAGKQRDGSGHGLSFLEWKMKREK